jgi:hypothetical protein
MRMGRFEKDGFEGDETIDMERHEFLEVDGSHAFGLAIGDGLERVGKEMR